MEAPAIIFYTIAAIMITFSLLAVTSRRILRAAVYLLFALGGTAALYFMVDYYFLAAVQLIVYAGGIVVLIIFSIVLTTHINEKLERPAPLKVFITALVVLGTCALTIHTLTNHSFIQKTGTVTETTVSVIGEKMMGYGVGGYVLPFEVISILLLAAMVGAIVIAKRTPQKP